MTPDDEARFIQLWQQGLSHEALAQRLACPVGTVKSRASTLQRQGKIAARPRGGTRQRGQPSERPPSTVHRPPSDRPPSIVHPATVDPPPSTVHDLHTDLQAAVTAALQPVLARLEALETGLQSSN